MKKINKILEEKILLLDGPMGTMIQKEKLEKDDFVDLGLKIIKYL